MEISGRTAALPSASGAATALAAAGASVPSPVVAVAAGVPYTVQTTWRGRPHSFEVRFGRRFSAWAAKTGTLVDLEGARILKGDGQVFPLVGPTAYREETGREPHPWLHQDPILGVYGLPTQPVTVELTPEGVVREGTERPFALDFDAFRERPNLSGFPTPEELSPLPDLKWLEVPRELPGDVLVYARTPELADRAVERVESILGHRGRQGMPTLSLEVEPQPGWTDEDLAAAREARRAEVEMRSAPVRVFVVPDDRHWLALPFMEPLRESLAGTPQAAGKAAFMGTNLGLMVFVPESDLASGGFGLRHELYHALETKFLTDEERALVSSLRAEVVQRGGPFQSVYGYQRDEFLTTMAEEFEGEHGPDGPGWLKEKHPRLEALLRDATGR